jgi:magnesium transporter
MRSGENELFAKIKNFLKTHDFTSVVEFEDGISEISFIDEFYLSHPSDQAKIIDWCILSAKYDFVKIVFKKLQSPIFTHISQRSLEFLFENINNNDFIELFSKLESDDAISVIEDLDIDYRLKLLSLLPASLRVKYNRLLSYKENSIGRIMNVDFPSVNIRFTAQETLDYLKECRTKDSQDSNEDMEEIILTDENDRFYGLLSLSDLLVLESSEAVEMASNISVKPVSPNDTQKTVAKIFVDYGYKCVPVVNRFHKVVGVVDSLAISDYLEEEAESQILRAKGVFAPKNIDDGKVSSAIKSRSLWLFINLLTAILSSIFISFFEAEISKLAPLAVLMPIVASMGGNAANQSATVTIRFVNPDVFKGRYLSQFKLEVFVATINGFIFAAIGFLMTVFWYHSVVLALVLSISMMIALLAAGIFGFLIPMLIVKLKFARIDPAVASTVILTTITDIIGFAGFLLLSRLLGV